MNLVPNEREKKAIFAELKTEYLYILIPFILLISVKLYISDWREIILSAEWSLASCIYLVKLLPRFQWQYQTLICL